MKKNNGYTFEITKDMATAKTTARVSTKHSQLVARHINGIDFTKAKLIVEGLIKKKVAIDSYMGKYYTKTSQAILKLLKLLESNAINKGLNPNEMKVFVSAHKGPTYLRSRRKRIFGIRLKVTHLQAVLKPVKKSIKKEDDKK